MKFWSKNMEAAGYTCMNGTSQGSGNVRLTTSPSGAPVARYANQLTDDYLTPTSPVSVSPQPPTLPDFPPSFSQLHLQPTSGRNQPFSRADSGIEADCSRSPLSSTSTANPRTSTLYEYIDPIDVKVTESHHSLNQGGSASSGVSSAGTTATRSAYSADPVSDTEDGRTTTDGARRRANPVYEALEKSATRLYAQSCHCKLQSAAQKQLRYLWCAFIVLIIITIFLLAVMAYILFNLIPDLQSRQQTQDDRIQEIESKYAKFFQESNSLHQFEARNATEPGSVLSMITQLNESVTAINFHLDEVSTDLQLQIQNISLTPGPQGPSGIGNLSSCYFKKVRTNRAPGDDSFTTSYQPEESILQDHIVMSASCGANNAMSQELESTDNLGSNKVQYRCHCAGEIRGGSDRVCTIYLIICPRLPN